MALVPTNHLYPRTNIFMESLNSSLFKLPVTTRLQFLSYAYYATPFRNLSYYAVNSCTTISASIPHQNPPRGSTFYRVTKKKQLGLDKELAICKGQATDSNKSRIPLLDRWNEIHKKEKLKGHQPVAGYRNCSEILGSDYEESNTASTMEKIVQKMKRVSNVDYAGEKKDNLDRLLEQNMSLIEEGNIPTSRHGFSEKMHFGVDDNLFSSNGDARFPWEKPELSAEEEEGYSVRHKSKTSLAESILPETELYRLRRLTFKVNSKMKIGGAGVTHKLVENIHEKWKGSEIVRFKVEGVPALNMKRVHEMLERKTGGLVIWRSGTSISLYRGVGYKVQSEQSQKQTYNKNDVTYQSSLITTDTSLNRLSEIKTITTELVPQEHSGTDSQEGSEITLKSEVKYEEEIEKILHGLGPRYTDFPGPGPLPVDADLLPGVLPDYKAPFRILPYGVRSTLNTKEATALRRLARVIPPHFALGRSRQHQGLAAAMVKLWERSSIAKIALKRGVQLTTSERMADDIKKLTGGTLLSRNKDFLVFYRGKDFLSPDVAEALVEKERLGTAFQDEEEQARLRASVLVAEDTTRREEPGTAGTLGETLEADARWGKRLDDEHKEKVMGEAENLRHANLVRKLERKVAFVERKIFRAERALSKVEQSLNPAEPSANLESITDDERYMFQKLGMRMKAFLLLGRRGVFDGTVENMHLHWKYRELVKIIVKAKNFEQAKNIAVSLEAESGGVLVSVNKISKGYAIIVFRGKDYMTPSTLRPKNLLTKRKALARSIELQRHEALVRNISTLQARYDQLRSEIEQMVKVEDHGDEELYNRIDSAYSTEDEESEEERSDSDTYPEVFDENADLLAQSEEEEQEEEGDDVYHEVYEKDDDLVDQSEEEDGGDDARPEDYKHGEDDRLLKQRRESMNNCRLETFSYEP